MNKMPIHDEKKVLPSFLVKLVAMLNDPIAQEYIAWDETGSSFHIYNGNSLSKDILPLYYKHNNLSSFIRQLNMYGFRKINKVENPNFSTIVHEDLQFYHEYFIRNAPDLLYHIERKINQNSPNVKPSQNNNRNNTKRHGYIPFLPTSIKTGTKYGNNNNGNCNGNKLKVALPLRVGDLSSNFSHQGNNLSEINEPDPNINFNKNIIKVIQEFRQHQTEYENRVLDLERENSIIKDKLFCIMRHYEDQGKAINKLYSLLTSPQQVRSILNYLTSNGSNSNNDNNNMTSALDGSSPTFEGMKALTYIKSKESLPLNSLLSQNTPQHNKPWDVQEPINLSRNVNDFYIPITSSQMNDIQNSIKAAPVKRKKASPKNDDHVFKEPRSSDIINLDFPSLLTSETTDPIFSNILDLDLPGNDEMPDGVHDKVESLFGGAESEPLLTPRTGEWLDEYHLANFPPIENEFKMNTLNEINTFNDYSNVNEDFNFFSPDNKNHIQGNEIIPFNCDSNSPIKNSPPTINERNVPFSQPNNCKVIRLKPIKKEDNGRLIYVPESGRDPKNDARPHSHSMHSFESLNRPEFTNYE